MQKKDLPRIAENPMCDRYFSDVPIVGDRAVLSGPEAHHLIHVMRAKAGMRVVVFDGRGGEFLAEVQRVGRAEVELAVQERREIDRELPLKISLAVALPKGDRQKWLVEKAVELGIAAIVPIITTRSVAKPDEHALGRLRRAVIEASKQCGRNRLLEISPPQHCATISATMPSGHVGGSPIPAVREIPTHRGQVSHRAVRLRQNVSRSLTRPTRRTCSTAQSWRSVPRVDSPRKKSPPPRPAAGRWSIWGQGFYGSKRPPSSWPPCSSRSSTRRFANLKPQISNLRSVLSGCMCRRTKHLGTQLQ